MILKLVLLFVIQFLYIVCFVVSYHQLSNGELYQQQNVNSQNHYINPPQMPYSQQQPQYVRNNQFAKNDLPNNILHDQAKINDKQHLKEHLGNVLSEPDLNTLSEEELQFYYFKIHDSDNNNKLDGSELIKSLIHWHIEESKRLGYNSPPVGTTKLFTDDELSKMIDPILESDDRNKDGFIDYSEFITAQKSRNT